MREELNSRLQNIEIALNSLLPENIKKDWKKTAFFKLPKAVSNKDISNLTIPCRELMTRGGKRWRPILSVLSCELAGGKQENIYPLTPLIELCHTASLIHDDIEDNSKERRGDTTIHLKYGIDTAINAGSWLYFQAMAAIVNYSRNKRLLSAIFNSYSQNLRRLHLGQAMDINWHSSQDYIPTKDEYLAMINLKTGSLARLAGELGFIAARKSEKKAIKYGDLMAQMGVSFQIIDDIKNISKGIKGKDFGDDIVEGKKSLPVILYLEKNPENKEKLLNLFKHAREEGINSSAVKECIQLISNSEAIKESQIISDEIMKKATITIEKKYKKNNARDLIFELFNSIL